MPTCARMPPMPPSLSLSTRSKILTPTPSPASLKGICQYHRPPPPALSVFLLLTCVHTIKILTTFVNMHKLCGTQKFWVSTGIFVLSSRGAFRCGSRLSRAGCVCEEEDTCMDAYVRAGPNRIPFRNPVWNATLMRRFGLFYDFLVMHKKNLRQHRYLHGNLTKIQLKFP